MNLSDDEKEMMRKVTEEPGFFKHNNFSFVDIKDDYAELRADLDENSMNPFNIAHGGLIFGLGDMTMGVAVATCGRHAVTLNANINYLRPGVGKYLIAKARVIKRGKTTSYLKCDIYNDKDVLVAVMDSNYYFID